MQKGDAYSDALTLQCTKAFACEQSCDTWLKVVVKKVVTYLTVNKVVIYFSVAKFYGNFVNIYQKPDTTLCLKTTIASVAQDKFFIFADLK